MERIVDELEAGLLVILAPDVPRLVAEAQDKQLLVAHEGIPPLVLKVSFDVARRSRVPSCALVRGGS